MDIFLLLPSCSCFVLVITLFNQILFLSLLWVTEFCHMAHFWMSYGRCTIPGSPMGRSEGLPRRWTG